MIAGESSHLYGDRGIAFKKKIGDDDLIDDRIVGKGIELFEGLFHRQINLQQLFADIPAKRSKQSSKVVEEAESKCWESNFHRIFYLNADDHITMLLMRAREGNEIRIHYCLRLEKFYPKEYATLSPAKAVERF